MTLSIYKDLLCDLDTKISNSVKSFCRSETYGYKTCKSALKKLIYVKNLLESSFDLSKLKTQFYSCNVNEDGSVTTVKKFNKIVGNKIELVVKKTTRTVVYTEEFNFPLAPLPTTNGFYIYSLFINFQVLTEEDILKVVALLEKLNYLDFFNFKYNSGEHSIISYFRYIYTNEFSYEYVDFDVLSTLNCVDAKQIKKLIENVC
jgi:hypothetical protein